MAVSSNLELFPIPVNVGTLGEASRELNKQLIADCFTAIDTTSTEMRSGINITQTVSTLETQFESFAKLQKIITDYSKDVIKWAGTHNTDINAEFFWS